MAKNISAALVGNGIDALQAALYLARLGIHIKFITSAPALSYSESDRADTRLFWTTALNTFKHPLIDFLYNTQSISITGSKGSFLIQTRQNYSFVNSELCTGCKKCEENCSTLLSALKNGKTVSEHAVHKPYAGRKSVPSTMVIDKNQTSPCRAACPLGINVQGFVSLLANNKIDEAYALINRAAPLGGILGRLCKHPCEYDCSRKKIDSPVSIRALHRYACDNVGPTCAAQNKKVGEAAKAKVAIIGSGPAGLMAAWDLKRRGYEPTIFESHNTFGGMLATGIPRFRLSKEIREREINKLLDVGIKIRTGITVGRDIDFAYLKERGYKAYFLAIGALKNNKLHIAGEDLEGVIDCMSFLITLNQMDELFVGSNIVVIGDGNTAVDSARSAIRKNMGAAKIVSWTVPEELTASEDEILEAFEEGVSIEYSAFPVEILGDEGKVVGVRCQRTTLTNEIMRNGRHRPEPIPGSDFVIPADHVIVAIGQSADASQLNLEGLNIDKTSGTIRVNPVTLETNLRGYFAGGDCMRGPNHVVEAMADGMKAAESIDRFISNIDMEADRQDKPMQIAQIDIASVVASKLPRSAMPYLDIVNRITDYEETTLGFSAETASDEARRCLNCALCSECMECVKVCGANAISHDGIGVLEQLESDIVLKFDSTVVCSSQEGKLAGIYDFSSNVGTGNVMTAILRTILDLSIDYRDETAAESGHNLVPLEAGVSLPKNQRVGIFLCSCNGNNSSIIDFDRLENLCTAIPGVTLVSRVEQLCTRETAEIVHDLIKDHDIDQALVAACRCCNYDQVCYSCNDRRILCQKFLEQQKVGQNNLDIDYVNIRELCAWAHKDDRSSATEKAFRIIVASAEKIDSVPTLVGEKYAVRPVALFLDKAGASRISAMTVETLGYQVHYLNSSDVPLGALPSAIGNVAQAKGNPADSKFPLSLEISGRPGDYTIKLQYSTGNEVLNCGAVIIDDFLIKEGLYMRDGTYWNRLIKRIASCGDTPRPDFNHSKYESALAKAGLFITAHPGDAAGQPARGGAIDMAARILLYLRSNWITTLPASAQINSYLCRGCGNCAQQCPLIDLQDPEQALAILERCLCAACGRCTAACPTNAIQLGRQGFDELHSTIKAYLNEISI